MKKLALLLFAVLLFAGCTTTTEYEPKTKPGSARPADYPVFVYPENVRVPRQFEIIGNMQVGDTPLTVFGGSLEDELDILRKKARKMGADALQITSVEQPNFLHAKYRVNANLIRFTDVWESVSLTEKELLAYFRSHEKTLDPIEGIWLAGDVVQSRIGIMKNNARPGRDFIGFILNSLNPTWQRGSKKIDVTRGEMPWAYRGNFYLDDYRGETIAFALRSPYTNAFVIYVLEQRIPIVFSKVPPSTN